MYDETGTISLCSEHPVTKNTLSEWNLREETGKNSEQRELNIPSLTES